jgi:hypothetical protein
MAAVALAVVGFCVYQRSGLTAAVAADRVVLVYISGAA